MSRGTVWSNVSTYGSVGALGGQPPRATQPHIALTIIYCGTTRAANAPYICRDDHAQLDGSVTVPTKPLAGLFVDRSRQQWFVRDPEGDFRALPSVELPRQQRQPYQPTGETELEPVRGHYRDMLKLPF
jgi:hypothetical protein